MFISYSWHSAFAPMVDAIGRRAGSPPKSLCAASSAFYWIDILNVAQCAHTPKAEEWSKDDMGKFAQAIAASNAVVWLHCEPWHNPWVAQRVWCIYEVIQSLTKREGSCRTPVQRPHLPIAIYRHVDRTAFAYSYLSPR